MGDAGEPIDLSSETFQPAMADNPFVACILRRGPFAACAPDALAVIGESDGPWIWATIDLTEATDVAAMFGLDANEPHLLLMREQVVLYCEPLAAASPEATRAYLKRAAQLDMVQVRAALEAERAGRQSLLARRVCPTALRSR